MKKLIIIKIIILAIVLSFICGMKYYQHKATMRAIAMVLNDEVPQDKIATSVLDYCINNRTNSQLEKEILEIQKDSLKVKEILQNQE